MHGRPLTLQVTYRDISNTIDEAALTFSPVSKWLKQKFNQAANSIAPMSKPKYPQPYIACIRADQIRVSYCNLSL